VPGNVFDVIVVPLRLQLPESHRLKLPQKTASFDTSNAKAEPTRLSAIGLKCGVRPKCYNASRAPHDHLLSADRRFRSDRN